MCTIEVDLGEVLAVPEEAVLIQAPKDCFVDKGQGLFEPRDVVLSAKVDNFMNSKAPSRRG